VTGLKLNLEIDRNVQQYKLRFGMNFKLDTKHSLKRAEVKTMFFVSIMSLVSSMTYAESVLTKSATLTLSAVVNEAVSIRISPKENVTNLDLHTTQVDIPVATIYETSNSSTGYVVKARSENNSKIKNANSDNGVPYFIKYGGGESVSLSQIDKTLKEENVGGIHSSVPREVSLSFKGVPATSLVSGIYNDVITFTIESK